ETKDGPVDGSSSRRSAHRPGHERLPVFLPRKRMDQLTVHQLKDDWWGPKI
ncbi:hypothetical protein HAX54_028316, partial [Datura stramonium]|nr:hypothetical protein [Datura stramonium]